MGRHRGDDPQPSRWPAVLVLLPRNPGGELRRALVRAPGVSGGRNHVRQPRGVAQPGYGAAAGSVVRPGPDAHAAAAAAAARQPGARGSGGPGRPGLSRRSIVQFHSYLTASFVGKNRGPMQRAPFSCLLFVGMLVTSAHAQRDTTARLAGTVRSSINGLPISGVMVAVKGSRVFGVSDSTGSFALGGLPEGRQVVRILYGDSLSYEHEMDLKSGKTLKLAVLLDVVAAELAPIVVEAQTIRAERSLVGFYDRSKWTVGRFYTRAGPDQRAAPPPGGGVGEGGGPKVGRVGGWPPRRKEGGGPGGRLPVLGGGGAAGARPHHIPGGQLSGG